VANGLDMSNIFKNICKKASHSCV